MTKPLDFKKNRLLHVPISEELYSSAIQVALRKGFDSVQQVIRLLLTAFADETLQPYFAIDLLKEHGKKGKLAQKDIDIAKQKTDAQRKFIEERDKFEDEMNRAFIKSREEDMLKAGNSKEQIAATLKQLKKELTAQNNMRRSLGLG